MASLDKFKTDPQGQLMSHLKDTHCVMLGSPNRDHHMQPMAPQIDDEDAPHIIYFYSDKTSDLGKEILSRPGRVHMCHIEKDYQACVSGLLYPCHDAQTIDKFWSPMVDAWYPGGKTDSKLMMLKFIPESAAIWASDAGTMKFLYETAKANITDEEPDLGASKVVNM